MSNDRVPRFRRLRLGGVTALRTRTLDGLLAECNEFLAQRDAMRAEMEALTRQQDELRGENAQHRATIAQINQKLHELSMRDQEQKERDYQLVMAQQALMAGLTDLDPAFGPLYEACRTYTMTSVERLYALYKAVEYVVKARVPGDLLETGVWRGGSMMLTARALGLMGDTQRRLVLFDTYEGHPKPDADLDVDLWGNRAIDDWQNHRMTDESSDWGKVSLEEVRANMASTGYPVEKVVLVKGMVEKTAAANVPDRIALLRLDTDWHESTQVALEAFYPRLADGGVLIIDDYGHYRGQREAVDRYFEKAGPAPLLNRIDYSCRLAVKATARRDP